VGRWPRPAPENTMEIVQYLTQWIDSNISWGFLGFCLFLFVVSRFR